MRSSYAPVRYSGVFCDCTDRINPASCLDFSVMYSISEKELTKTELLATHIIEQRLVGGLGKYSVRTCSERDKIMALLVVMIPSFT